MIKQYKKKPVIVSAVQWTGNNEIEIMQFVGHKLKYTHPPNRFEHDNDITNEMVRIFIPTLEGEMAANRFDFIIKGVNGEFYPCKPDIFEKTYSTLKELEAEEMPEFKEIIDKFETDQKTLWKIAMCVLDDNQFEVYGADENSDERIITALMDRFVIKEALTSKLIH